MPDQPQPPQPPQPPQEKKRTDAVLSQQPGEKKQTKAIPGKPVEGGELRKETVRINLPPKLGDEPRPAPTVRLPGPAAGAPTPGGAPPTVKLPPPPPSGPSKKSDTAQVVTTVLPTPTAPIEAPKPTVKLKRADVMAAATPFPSSGAMAPAERAPTAAPSSALEGILSLVTLVLSVAVAVMLFLAK